MDEDLLEDGDIFDDDPIEEGNDETWFRMGMTREEKMEARCRSRNSQIIKLVGHAIGCHFL